MLSLPPLDGIVMANSLHYFKDREKILRHALSFLKLNGALLLVEYNVDSGNMWVPYPLSFETFQLWHHEQATVSRACSERCLQILAEIYSAVVYRNSTG